jgi:hypothetical protein
MSEHFFNIEKMVEVAERKTTKFLLKGLTPALRGRW